MARGPSAPAGGALHSSSSFATVTGSTHLGGDGTYSEPRYKQTPSTHTSELPRAKEDRNTGGILVQQSSVEEGRDVPNVEEHLQRAGSEVFSNFQKQLVKLDHELINFVNAVRQLGSSVEILSSSFRLRERLTHILFLFRENAAGLFPRKVKQKAREVLVSPALQRLRKHNRGKRESTLRLTTGESAPQTEIGLEDFPSQLKLFAQDVTTFLDCLDEFPEFTDGALTSAILSLEGDLEYWSSCLSDYQGQFKHPVVQRYLHDVSPTIAEHLSCVASALAKYIEIGVPTIRLAHKHAAANLINLSTVATFFSAVTATTMQFSYTETGDPLSNAVNGFWFASLVFSIGSVVNSLLGLSWKKAAFRSPRHRIPWWVHLWMEHSPVVFLILSIITFSAGLVVFAYSTHQHPVTSTVTSVLSAVTCLGLVPVSIWFAYDLGLNRYVRYGSKKLITDATKFSLKYSGLSLLFRWSLRGTSVAMEEAAILGRRHSVGLREFGMELRNLIWGVICFWRPRSARQPDVEKSDSATPPSPSTYASRPATPLEPNSNSGTVTTLLPISEHATDISDQTTAFAESASQDGSTHDRFKQAVRSVMKMRRTTRRQGTGNSDAPSSVRSKEPPALLEVSRVAALVPRLKCMDVASNLMAHSAMIKHLQFSPNGKYLASSSWDKTAMIFRVGKPFVSYRTLANPQGTMEQVAWSPDSTMVLTNYTRGIKIWSDEGVCTRTIERPEPIQSVAWFPRGDAFISVEGAYAVKIDLSGKGVEHYALSRVTINYVAVTQDAQRILIAGTLTSSAEGHQPVKSVAEKQIISYNLNKCTIEHRLPVIHDIQGIVLSKDDHVALVSYDKTAPSQLWRLKTGKDASRLSLRHTYLAKIPIDYAGPSCFGGRNEQLIVSAGRGGDIHIWDRETAALLHHIHDQGLSGGYLTCIAWNPTLDCLMFATGTHEGAIRVWTTLDEHYPTFEEGPSSRPISMVPRTSSPASLDSEHRVQNPLIPISVRPAEWQDGHQDSGTQPLPQDNQDLLSSESAIMYRGDKRAVTFT